MKKTILMFAAAGLMLATPSCKKGENDPGLSLSSRTARLAGTWDLSGFSMTDRNDEVDGDYQTSSATLSGDVITSSWTSYDAASGVSVTNTSTITLNKAQYVIEKDGTWSKDWNTTTVATSTYTDFFTNDEHTVTSTTVSTSASNGTWSFLGKVKGGDETFKKKERVILNTLSSTGTSQSSDSDLNTTQSTTVNTDNGTSSNTDSYTSGEWQETYEIDQLKGKEMIWKTNEANSGSSSFTSGGTTVTSTDDVYTADGTWTWTIVK